MIFPDSSGMENRCFELEVTAIRVSRFGPSGLDQKRDKESTTTTHQMQIWASFILLSTCDSSGVDTSGWMRLKEGIPNTVSQGSARCLPCMYQGRLVSCPVV